MKSSMDVETECESALHYTRLHNHTVCLCIKIKGISELKRRKRDRNDKTRL